MVNRKQGPQIHDIKKIEIPPFKYETLDNGLPLIIIPAGTQSLVNVELVQKGGRFLETKKGVAVAASKLKKEGTSGYSSSALAEKVDFYGASLATGASLDFSYGKLFTLSKYFNQLFPLFNEVMLQPTYPEEEVDIYKKILKEKIKAQQYKNDIVAYRSLTELLFGKDHPYGYNSTIEMVDELQLEDIQDYHKRYALTKDSAIIVSGHITEEILDNIRREMQGIKLKDASIKYTPSNSQTSGRTIIPSQDKSQSTIKVGRRLVNMSHPDYFNLFIANVLLGGFFGSRLMKKVREEKGYTYGISSSIDTYIYDGYFSINTDVSPEYCEETIAIIYEEIERLMHDEIHDAEFGMVKNYINGNILNLVDGPFRLSSMAKTLFLNDLDSHFFQSLSTRVTEISKQEIKDVIAKYLPRDEMIEVIVGKC